MAYVIILSLDFGNHDEIRTIASFDVIEDAKTMFHDAELVAEEQAYEAGCEDWDCYIAELDESNGDIFPLADPEDYIEPDITRNFVCTSAK